MSTQRHHSFATGELTKLIAEMHEVNRLRDLIRKAELSAQKSVTETKSKENTQLAADTAPS